MELIVFSQSSGFSVAERPSPFPEWKSGESLKAWVSRCGFTDSPHTMFGVGAWEDSGGIDVYFAENGTARGWYALVHVGLDVAPFWVLVENSAELLALAVKLAPVARLPQDVLVSIQTTIVRAFRAWHGHDPGDPCDECDPFGAAEERAELERKAAPPNCK